MQFDFETIRKLAKQIYKATFSVWGKNDTASLIVASGT